VAGTFHFEHTVAFSPENAPEVLRTIPALPGVFALFPPNTSDGHAEAQPYLTRAADLRRRITRMLAPPEPSADGSPVQSKRLNLRSRVARIDYTITGSEFESTLTLYHASASIFGLTEARRRLRLHTPFFLRFTAENAYPRVYSTNRLSKRALDNTYGPFPSRAAAERYCDAVLDLFKLRRCYEDLAPYPEHPGCVYQEMKKCLAPCNQAHTPEGAAAYTAEAAAVKRFFDTRGESMIIDIGLEREQASAAMEFEKAAALHTQWHKVKAAQALADELVQPIPKLRAIVVQKSAQPTSAASEPAPQSAVILTLNEVKGKNPRISPEAPQHSASSSTELSAAIFLLQSGCITGPERLSTLGVRAVKEQTSVGSSLYAQPLMLEAVPLEDPTPTPVILSEDATAVASQSKDPEAAGITDTAGTVPPSNPVAGALSPELRAATLIATLEQRASTPTDLSTLSDHLSLLRRWYYRPEKQRAGEIFFPNPEGGNKGAWPIRRILNGAARMSLGDPKPIADTQRDLATRNPEDAAQKPNRTKILHEGRPDVERVVPIIDKPPAFKSRRKQRQEDSAR
jgi:excinuclease ABC subunit C